MTTLHEYGGDLWFGGIRLRYLLEYGTHNVITDEEYEIIKDKIRAKSKAKDKQSSDLLRSFIAKKSGDMVQEE